MCELPFEAFVNFKETKFPEEQRIKDLLVKSLEITHPDYCRSYIERSESIKVRS